MSYQGFYINLDRSTARRAEIESELARCNLTARYKRFSAVNGNPLNLPSTLRNASEVGCFMSHVGVLDEALKNPQQHLHVIEDDAIFAACTAQTVDWAITSGLLDKVDILFTDIGVPYENNAYRRLKLLHDQCVTRNAGGQITRAAFQVMDLSEIEFNGTSSYLVNKNSMAKLRAMYQAEIDQGLRVPIDVFFRLQAEVGALKCGCLFPFVTSVRVEHTGASTVRMTPDSTGKFTASNIGRYTFFIDCDWNECERLANTYTKPLPAGDRHAQMLGRLLAFSLLAEEEGVR